MSQASQLHLFGDQQSAEQAEASAMAFDARPGDVWSVGGGRLFVGDFMDPAAHDGRACQLMLADPPYGMGKASDGVVNDNLHGRRMDDFSKAWLLAAWERISEASSLFVWGCDESILALWRGPLSEEPFRSGLCLKNIVTWDKGHVRGELAPLNRSFPCASEKAILLMRGPQEYSGDSENFFEGFRPLLDYLRGEWDKSRKPGDTWESVLGTQMGQHYFTTSQWSLPTEKAYETLQRWANGSAFKREYSELKREYSELKREFDSKRSFFDNTAEQSTDVWREPPDFSASNPHPTKKPVHVCLRAVTALCPRGGRVLIPFAGSGSEMVACAASGRSFEASEISPRWASLALSRAAKVPGFPAPRLEARR